MLTTSKILALIFYCVLLFQCTGPNLCDPMQNKGIGPIKNMELGPVNSLVAAEGQALYDQLCRVCHNEINQQEGPAHWGIMNRRTPEWIMNMMLNPKEMAQNDPITKILAERVNGVEMPDMNLTKEEATKILEYFRTLQ